MQLLPQRDRINPMAKPVLTANANMLPTPDELHGRIVLLRLVSLSQDARSQEFGVTSL